MFETRCWLCVLLALCAGCAGAPEQQEERPPAEAVRIVREVAARLPRSLAEWEERGRPSYLRDEVFWAGHAMAPAMAEPRVWEVRVGGYEDPEYTALYDPGQTWTACQDTFGQDACGLCASPRLEDLPASEPDPRGCARREGPQRASHCRRPNWLQLTSSAAEGVQALGSGVSALQHGQYWILRCERPSGVPVCLWWRWNRDPPASVEFIREKLADARADELLAAALDWTRELGELASHVEAPELKVCRARLQLEGRTWRTLQSDSCLFGGGPVFMSGQVLWQAKYRIGPWVVLFKRGPLDSWSARASVPRGDERQVVVLHGGALAGFRCPAVFTAPR